MHIKRSEILEAAQAVIVSTGRVTRMADIAKSLGIETSSLYYYFKGVPEILNVLLEDCSYDLTAYEAQISSPEKQNLSVLYELLSYLLRFYRNHLASMRLLVTQVFPLFQRVPFDDEYTAINAYLRGYWEGNEVLLRYIRVAQEEGTITSTVPSDSLLTLVRGTMWGIVASWQDALPEEQSIPDYVHRIMRAIK
jgi:AcrR family transcriptional regulator